MISRCYVRLEDGTICGQRKWKWVSTGGFVAWYCDDHDAVDPDIWSRV